MATRREDERSAADTIDERADLEGLREASKSCRGCPPWERATQTVFGAGPATARLLFVGE